MALLSPEGWNEFLSHFPDAHILQTTEWGDLKSAFGWRAGWVGRENCGAQVLFRSLPLGLSIAYIPKGPVGDRDGWAGLWGEIDGLCRARGAVHLIVEPDIWEGSESQAPPSGFRPGSQTIQPPRTIVINLEGDEGEILGRMKQKTRYNIHLAQKRGVQVAPSDDIELFHRLALETGERDGFGVHSLEYYRRTMALFTPSESCRLLMAEVDGDVVAGLIAFRRGARAWYFYGVSSARHREHMPTYLLQWEAIRWARACGCREYDLWGVPDAGEAELEAQFITRSDGLWGVYRFKRGFGGSLRRSAGPWERVYNPALYKLYHYWTKRGQVDG